MMPNGTLLNYLAAMQTHSATPFARIHVGDPNTGGSTPALVAVTRCVYRSRNPM